MFGGGFAALGRGGDIFVNLVYANGLRLDTRSMPVTCQSDADGNVLLYPDPYSGLLLPVCSSGTGGQRIRSDGDFTGAVNIPASAPAGRAQLCASSMFANPVCTPITIE